MESHAGTEGVAGVDEAGRGPLAGPVVAAAVMLDPACPVAGLDDSKRLSARRRARLADEIRASARTFAVIAVEPAEIDRINILQASLLAMQRAVTALDGTPAEVLVDGNRCPVLEVRSRAIIGGDGLEPAIAAASILAKVERDRLMCALDGVHPGYDFASHKGYGTAAHLEALQRLGACPAHRRSFAPVRAVLDQWTLDLEPATANHE